MLLGRKCIAIPFSSKFLRMKHPPVLSHQTEWKSHIGKATTYDDALSESRTANIKFYADVMDSMT
jgi:hypothetical protein